MRRVAVLGFFVCLGGAVQAAPARPPVGTPQELFPREPPQTNEGRKAAHEALFPSRAAPVASSEPTMESDAPSPIAWLVATVTSIGMLLAISWAALERRRVRLVTEELSRIRMHRTAPLRVTAQLGKETADRDKPPA